MRSDPARARRSGSTVASACSRPPPELTEGRYAALELSAPKGFASPLHIHRTEDEFFIVLSGEVRVRHGEEVIEAVAGSLVYGPRDIAHAFRVDSEEARILLIFGPGGVEGFFREGGKPARSACCRLRARCSSTAMR